MVPHLQGEFKFQQPSGTFTFWLAIEDFADENSVCQADCTYLMDLLRRNDDGKDAHGPSLSKTAWLEPMLPFCHSDVVAMNLGFFAQKLVEMKLVQIRAQGFLCDQRPYAHPLGTFWIVSQSQLAEALAQKSVQISYCKFEMKASLHGTESSSNDLLDEALRSHLRKRKLLLTSEMDRMRLELSAKKIELENIQKTLDKQNEAA